MARESDRRASNWMRLCWALAAPLLLFTTTDAGAQEPAASSVAGEYRALVKELAGELQAAGFEVDLEGLSIEVRSREERAEELARWLERERPRSALGTLRVLNAGLGIDVPESAVDLEELVAAQGSFSAVAYYEPSRGALVFIDELLADDGGREGVVLHELAHAWRDQHSDRRAWHGRSDGSFEDESIRRCITEGEADLIAKTVLLARSGVPSEEVCDRILEEPAALIASALPYDFGLRFAARVYRAGGPDAMDAVWDSPPSSSEQLMHAAKLNQDAPTLVELPPWPQEARAAELIYETTLGELELLAMLLGEGDYADRTRAYRASIGWDGDKLRIYRDERGDTVLFRSVWDSEEDAEQFESSWDQLTKGKVERHGRVVDWVYSYSTRVRNLAARTLAASPMTLEPSSIDARSARAVEESLVDPSKPHVRRGRWFLPARGVTMPAPAGWKSIEVGAVAGLFAPQIDGFADSLVVHRLPRQELEALDEFREQLVRAFEQEGLVIEESKLVRIHGQRAIYDRVRNQSGAMGVIQATIRLFRADETILIQATVSSERWPELEEQIDASFQGIRFADIGAPHPALVHGARQGSGAGQSPGSGQSPSSSQGSGSAPRARGLERLRLPVSRNAIVDEQGSDGARPILNVLPDGRISAFYSAPLKLAGSPRITDAAERELRDWLLVVASRMKKEVVQGASWAPNEELLIRADASTPFYYLQKIMQSCGNKGIQIWRLTFAVASEPDELHGSSRESRELDGLLRAYLPRDLGRGFDQGAKLEVAVQVVEEGTKIAPEGGGAWSRDPDTSFVYGPDRVLRYTIADRETSRIEHVDDFLKRIGDTGKSMGLLIDAHTGVTLGEVIRVMDSGLSAGLTDITFVGNYE